jgi:hypothetical protein
MTPVQFSGQYLESYKGMMPAGNCMPATQVRMHPTMFSQQLTDSELLLLGSVRAGAPLQQSP